MRPLSTRTWTWFGAALLVLTVAVMARRSPGAAKASPEELRDAVAAPVLPAGARPLPLAGRFAPVPAPSKRPVLSERLSRLADALDAKAASLRSSASAAR